MPDDVLIETEDDALSNGERVSSPLFGALLGLAPGPTDFRFNPLPPSPSFDVAKLKAMAESRGIPVGFPGWEDAVIWLAASEHKELCTTRRGRGRPKASTNAFQILLGLSRPREAKEDRVLADMKMIQRYENDMGHPKCTFAQAARLYVELVEKIDPNNPSRSAQFNSRVAILRNQASRANKRRVRRQNNF